MDVYRHVTRHVQAMPEGKQIAAFFDFDGTLIDGFSAFVFIREQLLKGYIKPFEFFDLVAAMASYRAGTASFSDLMAVGARLLRGVNEQRYIEFSNKVYHKHIAKLVYPEARALIEAHLAKGHTVAIVSSATPYQLQPLATELGIEHVYCSEYQVELGEFTGELAAAVCWGEGKVTAIESLAKKSDIELENSCFYSDSDDDLAALNRVGIPRLVNPNESLQTIASGKGWPMQFFARTGKPSVLDYVRSLGVYGSLLGAYAGGLGVWKLNGSKDEGQRFMLSIFTDVAFSLIGVKVIVRGQENLWKQQPCVVIFNHQSQADGLVMMKLVRDNFAAVGKKEIGKIKLFAKAYEFAGVIPIDRQNTQSAIDAMRPLVNALAVEGRNVVIAPEGTRSTTKKPAAFKKGAFHVAMQAGVPILPVVIHNAIDVQPKGQFAYRSGAIEVEILPPVDTSKWTAKTLNERINDVRNMYLTTLGFAAEPLPASGKNTAKKAAGATRKSSEKSSVASMILSDSPTSAN